MPTDKVARIHIFAYQVGFGDCFLIRFAYASGTNRHLLVDFGSMGLPSNDGSKSLMVQIAQDIADKCAGKIEAVVATHRHADHISGFSTSESGKASGDIIASLKPEVVLQPWTEQLDLPKDATEPTDLNLRNGQRLVRSLDAMHGVADNVSRLLTSKHRLPTNLVNRLDFLGQDNVKNQSAVKNLSGMGKRNIYAYFGKRGVLSNLFPGVKCEVLGPPTVKQTESIRKQRANDNEEFWMFQQARTQTEVHSTSPQEPFPNAEFRSGGKLPTTTRWIAGRVLEARGSQLLGIVTALDKAMNNTSLILLFTCGRKKLLFPGDAQIENWSYALSFKRIRKSLESVDVYKVGHHGSRNATPRSLWDSFGRKGKQGMKDRLTTMLSTMPGKHGSEANQTEVPRASLLKELRERTELHSTHDLAAGVLYEEVIIAV